jgi:hypothetical protein
MASADALGLGLELSKLGLGEGGRPREERAGPSAETRGVRFFFIFFSFQFKTIFK